MAIWLWQGGRINPCRKTEEEYLEELDKLANRLLDLVSESLGLKLSYLCDYFCGRLEQHLVVNYYPSCPQPDLVLGIQSHSDIGLLTLLVQDAAGLQVMKDGEWIDVAPMEGWIIVNVADLLEVSLLILTLIAFWLLTEVWPL